MEKYFFSDFQNFQIPETCRFVFQDFSNFPKFQTDNFIKLSVKKSFEKITEQQKKTIFQ